MLNQVTVDVPAKRGAEDSGRYFKYISEFVGLTRADVEVIQQTKPIIEKHLPEIVSKFYAHLLRYPPTRQLFLKKDGSIDQAYVELRMRHLTNFWLRTTEGNFDDDYARYIDYVGRAHTSHGADPHIYIAERYVIGQVGFVQHAVAQAITQELRQVDENLETLAIEAWDKLLMTILEMLARAYGNEREMETFDPLVAVDAETVDCLAEEAFALERDKATIKPSKTVVVGKVEEIPEGERKLIDIDGLSIGIFHFEGGWYAIRNLCLHRGGPVATGTLAHCTLTCPWHGFQYDITDGHLLVDPKAKLDTYPVSVKDGVVEIRVPVQKMVETETPLKPNEFRVADVPPGKAHVVQANGTSVAVFNVDGKFFATQEACTHYQGPLSEGTLDGTTITCPLHGSMFDVTTGAVVNGPAKQPLKTFRVTMDGNLGRVE
ncbi:MAG: Rieske 2Fe-2S domain-containing protein [Chloroflexi bacterium]|nr:Rieske 2Fe-2S domain-containing protein [Chloroflexota bacterium]